MSSPFARLPAVSALLAAPELAQIPHAVAVEASRRVLEEARGRIREGETVPDDLGPLVLEEVHRLRRPRLRRVINATGIVVHTNLGRAPLAPEAAQAALEAGASYCNLELFLETGQRGGRLDAVADHLRALTGAEDAVVVNNCAAAVLLVLTALARDREVLVSRGELVEIGGSFRVPDVIASGGARLVEVGTTNRTRVADFAQAITEHTAVMMRIHPSNFRQLGFVERPDRDGLVALARERGIPLVEDLGSGLLGDSPVEDGHGLEDAVDAVVSAGVDLACCSGDKLLGGPQAGIIVGKAELIGVLRRHPLYRALRLDKMALAALEATLRMVREGRGDEVPVRAMLGRTPRELRLAAEGIARKIPGAKVAEDVGYSGGGALPAQALPTVVVEVPHAKPDLLARELRMGRPAVMARVARGVLILDPRTLLPGDAEDLVARLGGLLLAGSQAGG